MKSYSQILLTILALALVFALVTSGLLIGVYYYVAPGLPQAAELRDIKIQVPLQVYSRDGRLIDEYGEQKRTPVAYEHIPPLLIKAVLATEDEHFFEHPGIDWRGVVRAVISELTGSGSPVGGSTITQQVPRTLEVLKRAGLNRGFVSRIVAKYKEMILAYRMEQEFTKEEILELYLNTTFFGQRAYGVATAAQTYFGKNLDALSVPEIAILAGIPQRPTEWNPIYSTDNAAARRAYVLRRMRETGAITADEETAALAEPVISKRYGSQSQLEAGYVAEMVRAEMVARFGNAATTAGLKVTTTIDSRLQAAANRAMHANLIAYDERHGYRGPLGHVELPAGAANASDPLAPAEVDAAALRTLLDDYPSLLDYESAIVLGADDAGARVFFADFGEESIGLDAVEWAGVFVDDDRMGPKPATVSEVLQAGDVVRFRRTAEGTWRLAQIPEAQGAFVAVDPFDGAIVALNGGLDFGLNNFNRAVQARRQPGSAFKPFVYSAAFENGFTPATVVLDAPPDVGYQAELERVWRPENFNGKYYGPSRLREALMESMNAVSIRILQTMGVPAAVSHIKRFGFDDDAIPKDLSLALGAGGVAPVVVAGAYSTFANGGYKVTPYFIDRVVTADGEVLYESKPLYCPDCNTPAETPVQLAPLEPELVADATELYPQQRAAPRIISASTRPDIDDEERMRQGWSRVALGEVLEPSTRQVQVEPTDRYLLAGIYSFGRGLIDRGAIVGADTSYKALTSLSEGDIVVSKLNGWEGAVAVVDAGFEGFCVSSEYPSFKSDHRRLLPAFFVGIARSPWFWEALNSNARGSMVRRRRINSTEFLRTEVWLPSLDKQARAASWLQAIERAAGIRKEIRARVEALIPSALNEAFGNLS